MAFITGVSTTGSTTGNKSYTGFGFKPSYARFTLSQKTGTTEGFIHFSQGWTDGTNSSCHSIFQDATSSQSKEFTNQVISHWNRVSGTLTEVIAATFVSFDADGLTLNFSAITTGYHVHFEAFA